LEQARRQIQDAAAHVEIHIERFTSEKS
jgi:hypothetical protein